MPIPRCFAASTAPAMVGRKWSPVTKLILLAPSASSSKKISVSRSGVISRPACPREMARFWQYTQPRLHPEKNTVPEPFVPEMHGSSQKCSAARATRSRSPTPQAPGLFVRSIPHFLGHRIQFLYAFSKPTSHPSFLHAFIPHEAICPRHSYDDRVKRSERRAYAVA